MVLNVWRVWEVGGVLRMEEGGGRRSTFGRLSTRVGMVWVPALVRATGALVLSTVDTSPSTHLTLHRTGTCVPSTLRPSNRQQAAAR